MLNQLDPGPEMNAMLLMVGRVARVNADSKAFALLLEHACSINQLRDLWTEMSETGVCPMLHVSQTSGKGGLGGGVGRI